MRFEVVHKSGSRRLILIFAGWGMDANVFRGISHRSYDIAVVWDYKDITPGLDAHLSGYEEICILAWSFGVFMAGTLLEDTDRRITCRIAVNGTMTPVDDEEGIPLKIFHGTLAGMDERNLMKFRRRMCGSSQAYGSFMAKAPDREIEEMVDELKALGSRASSKTEFRWDVAVVGERDAIFPPSAQMKSWEGKCRVEQADEPHLPDFESIIRRHIIDKTLVEKRFGQSKCTYTDNAEVQGLMARRLFEMAKPFLPDIHRRVLEIGCGTGILTHIITEELAPEKLTLWDIVDYNKYLPEKAEFCKCDAETAIHQLPDNSEKVIFSSATMQWFNSPFVFIREIARVLEPGGIAALSTFLPDNMRELTDITGVRLQLPSAEELKAAASGFLEILSVEEGSEVMAFSSPAEILRHIRSTGVNGLVAGERESAAAARKLIRSYPASDDGLYRLTYRPLYLILRKPAMTENNQHRYE